MGFSLVLYTASPTMRDVLKARAKDYRADSGFDLEVYDDVSDGTRVTLRLLDTHVHAKVFFTGLNIPAAFLLMARSSLPTRGWILGNGTGLIDIKYCDTLKAMLGCVDNPG